MSIICAVVFLFHLVDEYQIFFLRASQDHIYGLRTAPWIPVFVHAWTVSFASLQGFLLTSRREKALGFFTANVSNGIFLGFGITAFLSLVILAAIVTNASKDIWTEYLSITQYLTQTALESPTITPVIQQVIEEKFVEFNIVVNKLVQYSIGLLSLFSFTPLLTALVNIASLNLVLILRKQINFNFNFGQFERRSRFDSRAGADIELDKHIQIGLSDSQIEMLENVSIRSAKSSESKEDLQKEGEDEITPITMFSIPALISASPLLKKRALSFGLTPRPTLESIQPTQIIPKRESLEILLEEDVDGYQVNLSRGKIRKLAKTSGDGEAYNHLKDLLRAERDLIVTGSNILILSISFAALTIWIAVRVQRSVQAGTPAMSFKDLEVSIFAGHWIYATFVSLALSINLYTGISHLRQNIIRSIRLNERKSSDVTFENDLSRSFSIGGSKLK